MSHHRTLVAAVLISSTFLTGCIIQVGDAKANNGDGLSSLFGNIHVEEHEHAGEISSVNGNVSLDHHAHAEQVSIVNGDLDIEQHVSLRAIDIVNGDINAGDHLQVRAGIATVNGDINLHKNSQIENSITSVNGDINLVGVTVKEDIETLNGDVNLSVMSVIFGDITYKKPDSKWFDSDDKPTLTIDKTVKIHGSIILNRPVSLVFENPAHHQKVVESYHVEQ